MSECARLCGVIDIVWGDEMKTGQGIGEGGGEGTMPGEQAAAPRFNTIRL